MGFFNEQDAAVFHYRGGDYRHCRRSRQQQVTPAGTTMRYEASFKPETGGLEMTFRLEAQQYHQLTVGEKGTLSYKGSRFEGFEPEL